MRTRSQNRNKELNEALIKTLKSCQTVRKKILLVKKLIKSGANINHQDHHGNTLLHNAKSVNEVQLLLKFDAKLNIKNYFGETPLLHKIRFDRKSSFDARKKVFRKTKPIIRELLRYGPNVNLKDSKNNSPLFEYVSRSECDFNIVKQIVNLGADILLESNKRNTLLHAAASNPYCEKDVIKYFIDLGLDPKALNYYAQTPLHCCVKLKNYKLDIVEILLKHGANPLARNYFGTPLYCAILNPYVNQKLLNLLLNYADLSLLDELDNTGTLMHTAVLRSNHEIVETLIHSGANVNVRDLNGYTPLHYAVKDAYCNEKLINVLIKLKANVDAQDFIRYSTPLHLAFKNSANMNAIKTLLECKPKLCILDVDEYTPLHYAVENPNFEVSFLIELLSTENSVVDIEECLKMTANNKNILFLCHISGNIEFLKIILKYLILKYHSKIYGRVNKLIPSVLSAFYSKLKDSEQEIYKEFSQGCMAEINQMMNDRLLGCITFYDVMVHRFSQLPLNQVKDVRQVIGEVLERMIGDQYPIYKNMVLNVKKEDFIPYLDVVKVSSAVYKDGTLKHITLDAFSVQLIADYLSRQDVINLISAFSVKSDSLKDNMDIDELCHKADANLNLTRELGVAIPNLRIEDVDEKPVIAVKFPLTQELKVEIQMLSQIELKNLCRPCTVLMEKCDKSKMSLKSNNKQNLFGSTSKVDQSDSTL